MESLPDKVNSTEELTRLVLFDYDILDFFLYPLSNDDFNLKWETIKWPKMILGQINVTRELQVVDLEKFKKEQISEISSFDKTIESLTVQVQAYQFENDPTKVVKLSNQCKVLSEQLKKSQEIGKTLNKRQILFELPEIELENIEMLIQSFRPYELLWHTAAEFHSNREHWIQQSLYSIQINEVYMKIESYKNIFHQSIDAFKEIPKVQEVPVAFLTQIKYFEPTVDVINNLKHDCWDPYYYKVFCEKTGLDIKYTKELNFFDCIEAGIMKHIETLKVILDDAIERRRLEEEAKIIEAEKRRKEEEILEARRQRRLARTDI